MDRRCSPFFLFFFFPFFKDKTRAYLDRKEYFLSLLGKENSFLSTRLGQEEKTLAKRKAKRPTDIISDPLDCTGLQHLGLEQGASQGWGGLPRGSLPPHCLPPPPGHHSHTHPPAAGASAFNPFHHSIEQRSPRLPGPNSGEARLEFYLTWKRPTSSLFSFHIQDKTYIFEYF